MYMGSILYEMLNGWNIGGHCTFADLENYQDVCSCHYKM